MEWKEIKPRVIESAEFMEIAGDFGDPLEVFREALHNAYDWGATEFRINISVEDIQGTDKLVLEFKDNGVGMSRDALINNFWNLGDSASKSKASSIGEKGHGTKIYLRSDRIIVKTSNGLESYESICENAFAILNDGKLHMPRVKKSDEEYDKGTYIRIEGYNHNQRGAMKQDVLKDYLYWFTVLGTIENQFESRELRAFKVLLKALDWDKEPELLKMGHNFAKENKNIGKLWDTYGENAADYYVKKYVYPDQTLPSMPEIRFDVVIYYEGDEAKRIYNPMIRKVKNSNFHTYKVSDRYGIWLCKDYVPVQRVNEWITTFGTGSNSFGLLHGFINCQKLKLTANRGTIANTNAAVIRELKECVQKILEEINVDLYKNDVMTLRQWRDETRALNLENAAFEKRKELIAKKQYFKIDDRTFLAPRNEAELYGLFISLYTLHPNDFPFEPLDYDESAGIDLLARNKTDNKIADCDFWYVELKYQLGASTFNHSFKNIRYIICWEIAPGKKDGSQLTSSVENEVREFRITKKDGKNNYYLENEGPLRIQVICLKDYLKKDLQITLLDQ